MTGTANTFGTDGPFTGTLGALTREYEALGGKDTPSDLEGYYEAAFAQENAALCLSGGGIRSAAFALGVVQALARMELLTRFQYLSTVSGGGYLGAWLSRWILDQRRQGRTLEQAATHVQEALARSGGEPTAVARLREDSNYLTPQLGVASPDTWTAIVLWLRNVLLNWLVLLPSLLIAVLVPNLYFDLLGAVSKPAGWVAAVLAFACLLVSTYGACVHLPTHRGSTRDRGQIKREIIWPALGWAALLPIAMAPYVPTSPTDGSPWPAALILFVATWVTAIAGYLGAMWRCWRDDGNAFLANVGVWVAVAAVSSAFLAAGVPVAAWILGSGLADENIRIGLTRHARAALDHDRPPAVLDLLRRLPAPRLPACSRRGPGAAGRRPDRRRSRVAGAGERGEGHPGADVGPVRGGLPAPVVGRVSR